MELVEFIRLVHIQIWPCDRRAQYRNNGDCLSSPHLEAVQLSFSLYVSGASDTLSLCHCPFTGAQSEYLQARVFVWALKRTPVFLVAFHLTWMDRALLVFTARYFVGSSSQHKAETPHSSGGNSEAEISLSILNHHTWVWVQPILHIHPSYKSQHGLFFIFLVIGIFFS